jgi:endonuclease/exonuclease/phosphatase family metal-dependent hydrolase
MKRLFRFFVICAALVAAGSGLLLVSHKSLYPAASPGEHRLTVLSYNTHRTGGFAKVPKNSVIRYLQQSNADVLCLQEIEVYKESRYLTLDELKKAFGKYPYHYFDFKIDNRRRQYGNAVFSKHPLSNLHTLCYDSRSNLSSCCDVAVQGDTLRLIVNHLESNRLESQDIDSVIQQHSLNSGPLKDKLQKAGRLRHKQAKAVHREVKASPYPVIVAGDFNDTPLSWTYLTIRCGLRDCFLRTSNGRIGSTFAYKKIRVRIDYILCSEELTPVDFHVDYPQGSDHYPIRTTLAW